MRHIKRHTKGYRPSKYRTKVSPEYVELYKKHKKMRRTVSEIDFVISIALLTILVCAVGIVLN